MKKIILGAVAAAVSVATVVGGVLVYRYRSNIKALGSNLKARISSKEKNMLDDEFLSGSDETGTEIEAKDEKTSVDKKDFKTEKSGNVDADSTSPTVVGEEKKVEEISTPVEKVEGNDAAAAIDGAVSESEDDE